MKQTYSVRKLMSFFILVLCTGILSETAYAGNRPISGTYSGAQEVPPNASTATGTITGVYNDFTHTIFYTITFSGLGSNSTAAHFHGPAAAGVGAGIMIAHNGFPTGVTSGTYSNSHVLTAAQEADLLAGLVYSNIHTTGFPGGEIRAQITVGPASPSIFPINSIYSGTQEVPPNTSPGAGTFKGAYDSSTNTIFYTIDFNALDSPTTVAHFHAPAPPGATADVMLAHAGFPSGVETGTYSKMDVLHDTAEVHLFDSLVYSNIHTLKYAGGEIRAQIYLLLAPDITCPPDTTVSNDPGLCSASLTFTATATGTPAPTISYSVADTAISFPFDFPVGVTTIKAVATNEAGADSCTFTVTVNDTEPPVIEDAEADPTILWPPNHKMREVEINYTATDNCGGVITTTLTVSSNQPVDSTGDGNTEPDWEVIDEHNVKLRAERAGNNGCRIYYVKITATDQYGNASDSTVMVVVPHDRSGNHACDTTGGGGRPGGFRERRTLDLTALRNPSYTSFPIDIRSSDPSEMVSVRIIDLTGRVVESRQNLQPNQIIYMGESLRAGVYIIELRQGNDMRFTKVVKVE